MNRTIEDYRTALESFRNQLKQTRRPRSSRGPGNEFDLLEDVFKRYGPLVERLHEREDSLEILEDEFEDQLDRAEDASFPLRTDWINRYHDRMDSIRSVQRHHQLVVDLSGLYLAGELSDHPEYRADLYRNELSRLFAEVLKETASDDVAVNHATRIYSKLFDLSVQHLEQTEARSGLVTQFDDLVRKHGLTLKQLSRLGFESGESSSLLRKIRNRVNLRLTP